MAVSNKTLLFKNSLNYVHTYRNDRNEGLDPILLISIVGCHFFQVFGVCVCVCVQCVCVCVCV